MKNQVITSLDLGSDSIKGVCLQKNEEGLLEALAHSQRQCPIGIRSGEIVRIEEVAKAIQRIKSDLGREVGLKIKKVLVNINGPHISSLPSQGLVSVSRADQKISQEDVQRVLKAAEAVNLPSNREILDTFPKEFIVDGEGGIKEPFGLEGIRLEAKVILSTVFSPVLANLEQALSLAGVEAEEIVLNPLAQAKAVLSEEQKELGVALVDIGFSTASVSVFEKGDLVDFSIFPVGSSHITNDLAIILRTEIQTAEEIKKQYAVLSAVRAKEPKKAKPKKEKAENFIEIEGKGLKFSKKLLEEVVESRVKQIFSEVEKQLKKIISPERLPAGIIFTGGGSLLPGIVDFAKEKFNLPCRIAKIANIKAAKDIEFALCYGLALLYLENGPQKIARKDNSFGKKIKKIFKMFLP